MPHARAAELLRRPPRPEGDQAPPPPLPVIGIPSPPFAPEFVRRPAVVSRLVRCEAPVVLIVAPPGYGKTSLIAEWEQWDERPFVWLAPATGDGTELPDLFGTRRGARPRRPLVVVLERAEQLVDGALAGLTERLLDELPQKSTLVVCSRTEPALPQGRLRAHHLLFEIRRPELAFTVPQAAELLRVSGLEVGREVVAGLVRETDGWPAVLYLAALSMRERRSQPDGPARFRGDDHLVAEYVRDEILAMRTRAELRWLSCCAVADELTSGLCQALTRRPGSSRMLPELARRTQLLEPTDAAGSTYRWNRLFRDCLLGELRRAEPELEQELHRRASAWHEQHGSADAAIEHACRARDPERAGRLLSAALVSYTAGGQAQRVLDWLSCFSREQIASSPALAMCAAHACLSKGSIVEAQHWAATARAALEPRADAEPTPDVEVGIAVAEAATARYGASAIRDAAERARALEGPAPGQWRPTYLHLLGVCAHLLGDPAGASTLLDQAIDLAGASAPCTTALAISQQAIIAIERGDWEQAEELADRASGVLAEHRLARYPLAALPYAVCAAVRARQGHIDQAKSDLRRGLELHAFLGDFVEWYCAETSILLAHAALWLADVAGARSLLAQASRFSRKLGDAVIFERWFTDAWGYMDTLAESTLNGPSSLTIAELRVLRFLPSHRSFREIAEQLGVSSNTVKSQAHAVYRKLGANSRSEAVTRASEAGLLVQ